MLAWDQRTGDTLQASCVLNKICEYPIDVCCCRRWRPPTRTCADLFIACLVCRPTFETPHSWIKRRMSDNCETYVETCWPASENIVHWLKRLHSYSFVKRLPLHVDQINCLHLITAKMQKAFLYKVDFLNSRQEWKHNLEFRSQQNANRRPLDFVWAIQL